MPINTTYGPSGLKSEWDLRGVDTGPAPDFWGDLNQIRTGLQPKASGAGVVQARALRAPAPAPRERGSEGIKSQLERTQERAAIAKLNAEMNPAPMYRTPGGFNNPSHNEMDVDNMNAYQRKLFLPASSSFANNGVSSGPPSQIAPQQFASWTEADPDTARRRAYSAGAEAERSRTRNSRE